jgi:hypothetical protein
MGVVLQHNLSTRYKDDAALIAAAPDMLAALHLVFGVLAQDGLCDQLAADADGGPDEINAMCDAVSDAIAKAQGN